MGCGTPVGSTVIPASGMPAGGSYRPVTRGPTNKRRKTATGGVETRPTPPAPSAGAVSGHGYATRAARNHKILGQPASSEYPILTKLTHLVPVSVCFLLSGHHNREFPGLTHTLICRSLIREVEMPLSPRFPQMPFKRRARFQHMLRGGECSVSAKWNFCGTTSSGGTQNNGTVFSISLPGVTPTTLYSFTGGNDGASPAAALVQGTDGNFYGTASSGGKGAGTFFQMNPANNPPVVAGRCRGAVSCPILSLYCLSTTLGTCTRPTNLLASPICHAPGGIRDRKSVV